MKTIGCLRLSDDGKTLEKCLDKNVISVKIPSSVTEIGADSFKGCTSLTSVAIPGSVKVIGWAAFRCCTSLTSVEIPSSVTEITVGAFVCCTSLKQIIVDEDNPNYCDIDGVLYSKDKKTLVSVPGSVTGNFAIPSSVTVIKHYAFSCCKSLTSVEIPSSVTKIWESAFDGCTSLTSVKIPGSVTEVGDLTFFRCASLTSVEIPSSVTKIGICAFVHCTSLTSVEIPSSVTEIGLGAFDCCTSLAELHCRHKKPLDAQWSECFDDVDLSQVTLYVPSGSADDYRHHPFFSRFKEVVTEK